MLLTSGRRLRLLPGLLQVTGRRLIKSSSSLRRCRGLLLVQPSCWIDVAVGMGRLLIRRVS